MPRSAVQQEMFDLFGCVLPRKAKPIRSSSGQGILKKLRNAVTTFFAPAKALPKVAAPPRVRRHAASDEVLATVWREVRAKFFADKPNLDRYVVRWSTRRQRRVLASCCWERETVVVAQELNHPDFREWLEPLLYHEMCHAALEHNVSKRGKKRAWHGPEFRALERQHPKIVELDSWIKSGGWRHAVRSHRARNRATTSRRRR